jgi:hypothetical protein
LAYTFLLNATKIALSADVDIDFAVRNQIVASIVYF